MSIQLEHHLMAELDAALAREKQRLGTVSPQFSYYQRLVEGARTDMVAYRRIHEHVKNTGGFAGL